MFISLSEILEALVRSQLLKSGSEHYPPGDGVRGQGHTFHVGHPTGKLVVLKSGSPPLCRLHYSHWIRYFAKKYLPSTTGRRRLDETPVKTYCSSACNYTQMANLSIEPNNRSCPHPPQVGACVRPKARGDEPFSSQQMKTRTAAADGPEKKNNLA